MENIPKVAVPEAAPPVEVPMSQVDESRLSLDERFARFFAPPTKPVGVGFIAAYVSAQFFLFLTIVVDVLPDPEHSGKDLGVFNIANALPQSLAPFIAPVFLAIGSPDKMNYPALCYAAGICAIIGGVLVVFVRKVT